MGRPWDPFIDWLEGGEPEPGEPAYDPAQLAVTLVVTLAALGVLFWLLWALLVCEGGLFAKIGPFLKVVFTSKTLADFGYAGHPYQLGVFEGWIVNVAALVFSVLLVAGLWRVWTAAGLTNDKP